ncbi:hypothetical protein BDF22DRAFT_773427 [Syncephalis plumigaleata]|nr:hypothetical protein BDF22DRAFT_773427 [Syncephalis plumigaleata]
MSDTTSEGPTLRTSSGLKIRIKLSGLSRPGSAVVSPESSPRTTSTGSATPGESSSHLDSLTTLPPPADTVASSVASVLDGGAGANARKRRARTSGVYSTEQASPSTPPAQKRRRRTKKQIEADQAAELDSGTTTPLKPETANGGDYMSYNTNTTTSNVNNSHSNTPTSTINDTLARGERTTMASAVSAQLKQATVVDRISYTSAEYKAARPRHWINQPMTIRTLGGGSIQIRAWHSRDKLTMNSVVRQPTTSTTTVNGTTITATTASNSNNSNSNAATTATTTILAQGDIHHTLDGFDMNTDANNRRPALYREDSGLLDVTGHPTSTDDDIMSNMHIGSMMIGSAMGNSSNKKDKPFACSYPGCTRAFGDQPGLTRHITVSHGERPYVCEYEGCDRRFYDAAKLRRHHGAHARLEIQRKDKLPLNTDILHGKASGQNSAAVETSG